MARYIDADKIITDAIKEKKFFIEYDDMFNSQKVVKTIYWDLAEFINSQPTADVVEVKHGHFVRNERNIPKMKEFHEKGYALSMNTKSIFYTCSECGTWASLSQNYCSECGAKMDGGKAE